MTEQPPRDNLRGAAWLFADMGLNIWALSIVKALGLGYPPAQIVFLRAAVGLLLLVPLIVHRRSAFRRVPHLWLQVLRVALSAVTLTASYFAIARVPLALYTTMNFTRPMVVMLLAAVVLRERITARQWGAAALAMTGIVIATDPAATPLGIGLAALLLVVLTGSGAVIVTRALRGTPEIVMMTFYTVGLGLCTLPFAMSDWVAVPADELPVLLLIGVFAQAGQLCFLRAHFLGEAGVLSVLGYASLLVSVTVGYLLFDEMPGPRFFAGAALVIVAALTLGLPGRRRGRGAGDPGRQPGR